jgi:hypothetical protein
MQLLSVIINGYNVFEGKGDYSLHVLFVSFCLLCFSVYRLFDLKSDNDD